MMINLLGTFSILVICCLCGFVAYANYFGCDPLLNKQISNYDQLLPFFVVDLLKNFYGLPGIFIACIYSAALSTISSGLNSLSAVFLHDFIYPFYASNKLKDLSHRQSILTTNFLGIIQLKIKFVFSNENFISWLLWIDNYWLGIFMQICWINSPSDFSQYFWSSWRSFTWCYNAWNASSFFQLNSKFYFDKFKFLKYVF